ncbi:MAG: glycosyl hydrolase family 18 protein, partial [Bacillota bacterium]|nr:glycosyl hydrolase family 18 protein [Bacillota bacterium]
MIEKLCMRQNYDGSCDIIIYIDRLDAEFAYEFLNGKLLHGFLSKAEGAKKIVAVRSIKLVVAGGLILSIPFSQFASKALYESRRYAMSYVYFGSASQQIQNVSLSYNTLNTVSPSYFDINADGTLKISGVSESFILAMHDNGIRVVPFLSNGWDRQSGINALKGMDKLSDGIAQVVETYNLDGINVDLENLTELQRADYTRFIKLLREKIPPGKEVSVAVASNPWGTAKGWQGSYDYRALSEYSDYLFIMTYDEHYSGGSPGAVASLSFVDKSMQYALKNVPKEKIVVGIPFYGRLWSTDGNIKGLGISLNRIQELIKKYPHKVFVDAASGSPVAHITVTDGFTLNGRTIKAGNYAIWYEDADSIKQKLALVGKYGLKGAG